MVTEEDSWLRLWCLDNLRPSRTLKSTESIHDSTEIEIQMTLVHEEFACVCVCVCVCIAVGVNEDSNDKYN